MASSSSEEEMWRGSVPVCIRLGRDVARPMYAMVPRLAYARTLEGRIGRHFREVLAPKVASSEADGGSTASPSLADSQYFSAVSPSASSRGDSSDSEGGPGPSRGGRATGPLWFSETGSGAPLRWDVPLGVALDHASIGTKPSLPWELTAHFGDCPDERAPPEDEDGDFKAFFHALKQAVHLERGTARAALAMPRVDQEALWAAVTRGDRAAFCGADLDAVAAPRHVPVRLLFADGPVVQLPVAPGDGRTLGDALLAPVSAKYGSLDAATATAHGVRLPWRLPLVDAWRALHYGDHFLYVVVAPS